jgi:hypothetical protein
MAMFIVFLLNLSPSITGLWAVILFVANFPCFANFFYKKSIFHHKLPVSKEKNSQKELTFFAKLCHNCSQYERVLKIFYFHILNIVNFG